MALQEGRFFTGSMTDKRFEADGFAEYCRRFLSSGVWDLGANLQVTPGGSMTIIINYGSALVDGYPYNVIDNGSGPLQLSVDPSDAQPRIDRVVIKKDVLAQRIYACVKKGSPAASPAPPSLMRSSLTYEISLAKISVGAGAIEITSENITDERTNIELAGSPFKKIALAAHPVGSIYVSSSWENRPAVIFGGTWTQIKDRFILGAGDAYANGAVGGALTHRHLSPITWREADGGRPALFGLTNDFGLKTGETGSIYGGQYTDGGENQSINRYYTSYSESLPPYVAKYIWERTA
ncbi:MAG: phage baseplate protein [Burkholderiales bacterium]